MSRSIAEELLARVREQIHGIGARPGPSALAVYCWVLGVMSYEGVRVLEVTPSQIHLGVVVGGNARYTGVGFSLNTIKSSLEILEHHGWLIISRKPAKKGEILRIETP